MSPTSLPFQVPSFIAFYFLVVFVSSIMVMIYPDLPPACVLDPAVYSDDDSWIALNKYHTERLHLCPLRCSLSVVISAIDKH